MGTSAPALVTSLLSTEAWSPSIRSLMYWIFSPPYSSIFEMYERSRRSPNSLTNSLRSACVRAAQCRPSERLAVSPKSKMSSAIWRTATRLSFGLSFSAGSSISLSTRSTCALSCSIGAPARAGSAASTSASVRTSAVVKGDLISAGSSISLSTRSTCALSCSIGAPARAGSAASTSASVRTSAVVKGDLMLRILPMISVSHLAEDVLRQQLLEVHGRLHLADLAAGRDDLVRAARTDPHVLLADQTLGLDRRDRVLLQLDALLHAQDHARLVVVEADRVHPADLDPCDLDRRAGLEPAHGREIHGHLVAAGAQERHAPQLDRKIPQGHDAEHHEDADYYVDPCALHQVPSGSPRMNFWTTRFWDACSWAGGPTSTMRPSCSMATRSAISKISGISWLTMTAVKRWRRWRSRIRWWIVFTRTGSSPVVGSSKNTISGSVTRARAMATRLRMPPDTSAGYFWLTPSSPTWASADSTRLVISALGSFTFSRRGKATLSPQRIESNRAPPWNTTP